MPSFGAAPTEQRDWPARPVGMRIFAACSERCAAWANHPAYVGQYARHRTESTPDTVTSMTLAEMLWLLCIALAAAIIFEELVG